MRIDRMLRLFPAFTAALMLIAGRAQAVPLAAEAPPDANLFSVTCGSSFCHGEAGIGARGPSLKNRNFLPDFVRNTVLNGRSGTPMPSFKDSLSQAQLEIIVGYVMSLSPNHHNENTGGAATATAPAPAAPATALSAKAQAGEAIFFDMSRPSACAACHSYREQGGPVGPDLTWIAKRSPREIYQGIVKPIAANPDYPIVSLITEDGKAVTGILKRKTDAVAQIYDLSSAPPVLRSLYGAKIDTAPAPLPYGHDLSGYSKDDLAALVTYLKSADAAAQDVTPPDLTK
jgi:putative heme-binding domain-containing protein